MILPDALEVFMPDAQSNLLYRIYPGSARAFCLRTHEIVGIKMRQISFRREKTAAEADVALSVVAPAERSGVTRTGAEGREANQHRDRQGCFRRAKVRRRQHPDRLGKESVFRLAPDQTPSPQIGEDRSARQGAKQISTRIGKDAFVRRRCGGARRTCCTSSRRNAAWRKQTYQDAFFTPGICPL